MTVDELKSISGINFERLASGKWRVKLGKKITGGDIVRKIGDESYVCKLAEDYLEARKRKTDNSLYISDLERAQAIEALNLLRSNNVKLSLQEIVRQYCDKLPKTKGITVQVACDTYLDHIEDRQEKSGSASSYYRNLKTYFSSFTHLYGERLLYEVTTEDIEEWLSVRCFKKSAKTYNNYLLGVRAMFAYGVKKKWLVEDVSIAVDKHEIVSAGVGVLLADDLKLLLQSAHDLGHLEMLLAFSLQAFAGLRRSEVMGLVWGDISKDSIRISATNAKTNKGRGVEILSSLSQILALFKAWKSNKSKSETVISLGHDEWDKLRREIMEDAGMKKWPHNCLRHTFVSARLAVTKNAAKTAYEAGHTVEVMRSHYDAVMDHNDALKHFLIIL